MKKELNLLGLVVEDKVTKLIGTVTSISFDLYGCIQALVVYGNKEIHSQSYWFDVNRLTIIDDHPVMERPLFGKKKKGPENKPLEGKYV